MTLIEAKINNRIIQLGKRILKFDRGPLGGTLFITRKCNFKCSYCGVANYKSTDVNTATWHQIIDRLKELGIVFINIVGGEPLLRKDIYDILEYLQTKKIIVVLHSNFSLLSKSKINNLSKIGLFGLTASLDSFNGFEKSNKSIYRLLEYAKDKGIIPIVSSVVTSKNINELLNIANYTISKGILYNISLYQNIGGVFSNRNDYLVPSKEDFLKFAYSLKNIKKETGGVRTTYEFLNLQNIKNYYYKWRCNPYRDYWLIVNNDGKLMRCEEYPSNFDILKLESLKDPKWIEYKKKIVENCPGCYHHCYFDAEKLYGLEIFRELNGINRNLKFVRIKGGSDDIHSNN